jgi:hypothetical protein
MMYENLRTMNPIGRKVVAKYKISTLFFDRDKLASTLLQISNKLTIKYGESSRICIGVFYDENYAPYLCRCDWKQSEPYSIRWTKDYVVGYLHNQNTQISPQDEIDGFRDLLQRTFPVYTALRDFALDETTLVGFVELCLQNKQLVRKAFMLYSNIGLSQIETDNLCNNISLFLSSLDNLILETEMLSSRGNENPKSRMYMANMRLEECEKHLSKLEKNDICNHFKKTIQNG